MTVRLTTDEWRAYAETVHPELKETDWVLTVVHGEAPEPTIQAHTEDGRKLRIAQYVGM